MRTLDTFENILEPQDKLFQTESERENNLSAQMKLLDPMITRVLKDLRKKDNRHFLRIQPISRHIAPYYSQYTRGWFIGIWMATDSIRITPRFDSLDTLYCLEIAGLGSSWTLICTPQEPALREAIRRLYATLGR